MTLMTRFLNDQSGATAIEYALIAALVSITIIGGATIMGTSINANFTDISGRL